MTLREFLSDRLKRIALQVICAGLATLFLFATGTQPGVLVILLIVFLLVFLTVNMFDFFQQRARLLELKSILDGLDRKYLFTECIPQPKGLFERRLFDLVRLAGRDMTGAVSDAQASQREYREYVERWVHEIKTPLSLSELVLENHREEMSEYVYRRMRHVQRMAEMDVERILYYARLHAEHVDYRFEKIFLPECVEEVLEEFSGMEEEKGVDVRVEAAQSWIVSDRRVLAFMLSQILGNAFKYTRKTGGIVEIAGWEDEEGEKEKRKIHLAVRDNGGGVPQEDIPFLFDKGFTGNHPGRQDATGMGLYFVKKYAEVLAVDVRVEEERILDGGFGIELLFPMVS